MFKWEKLGHIFDPTTVKNKSWIKEFSQAPDVLIFEKIVRVYFSCRSHRDDNGQYVSYSAYIDLDRYDLTKIIAIAEQPILPLGNLGEFDEFGTYPVSVHRTSTNIVAYYAGWTRCESVPFNTAIGMAVSKDQGKTFQKLGTGPIIPYSIDEPFVMSGPKIRFFKNKWYLFYIAGNKWLKNENLPEPVYKIRSATSEDGINWHKTNRNLIENVLEKDEAQASPDVFYANDKYHMFFCYRYSIGFRGKEKGYRIGYASSTDLLDWQRDDSKVGITISENSWDSEMISYPHVFSLDGNTYMFYLGNQVGRYGFGLAKLEGTL
jgi:hypothetical protein